MTRPMTPIEGAFRAEPETVSGASPDERPKLDWADLMARAQDGDRAAYRRLLEDVTPYLRWLVGKRLGSPADVEDVVQETLLTVHAIRHTFDPARPFAPWLAAIATRRVADWLRKQYRIAAHQTELVRDHETLPAAETNRHEEHSDGRVLRRAIAGLPPGQRRAVELVKLKEMSLKEAAAVSGVSVAGLKVAVHRAVKNLRAALLGRSETP